MSLRLAGVFGLAILALAMPSVSSAQSGVLVGSGYNESGQLGSGSSSAYLYSPVALSTPAEVVSGSSGYYQTLAVLPNGTVEDWGSNAYGELADGTKTEHRTPELITGFTGVAQVVAGYHHSTALLSNGEVDTWGNNGDGQLGNGTTGGESLTPTLVKGLSGVKAIAGGCDFDLALIANGTVEAWGDNVYGELGLGSKTLTNAPTVVPGLSEVSSIAAGCYDSYAVLKNGTV